MIVFEKVISIHDLFQHGQIKTDFVDKSIHVISASILILNIETICMALYQPNGGIVEFSEFDTALVMHNISTFQ
jgi:hypothetical protein